MKFGSAKRLSDRRGTPDGGSRSHDDLDHTKASSVVGGWLHQREKCDPLGSGVFREKEELHRAKFLGAGLFCLDRRARRGVDLKLHSASRAGR